MEDRIIMTKKELWRKTILDGYEEGKINLQEVAKRLEVSYRQAKRISRRYSAERELGLIHKSRGKRAHNAYPEGFKAKILGLYSEKYAGFGPTFASEKLYEDDGEQVHPETLRVWLKRNNLWTRKRKHRVYRERRERRARFGELLQIDGSIHAWLPGDKTHYCLLNMVDDATGISLARLDKGETTLLLLTVLKEWIKRYGIPRAVYVDLKSVYVSPKRIKDRYDDDLMLREGFSVFEQVCKKFGIEIIRAYSPQAKGRVERKHAVYQDRLVKDLKLYKLNTLELANDYLEKIFLKKINDRYAIYASSPEDAHRAAKSYGDLNQIICWNYNRQLKNDWTVQLGRNYYQVRKPSLFQGANSPTPGEFITIRKHLEGHLEFWYKQMKLDFGCLSRKPEPPSRNKKYYVVKGKESPLSRSKRARENKHKSPWSRYTITQKPKQTLRGD